MAWRRGTTSEAIAEAKRSSKIFIVYITGLFFFLIFDKVVIFLPFLKVFTMYTQGDLYMQV